MPIKPLYILNILCMALLFCSYAALGQKDIGSYCGNTEYNHIINPNTDSQQKLELEYRTSTATQNKETITDIVIPTVVHIIHQNGAENITDAQVLQGIQWLNEAFANSGAYQSTNGVDIQIQFCLAQRDPINQPFDGIVRHLSPYTDMDQPGSFNHIMENFTYDTDQYFNMRVLANTCLSGDCNIAGFGGIERGVVMNASYFGSSILQSNVIIHEVGHALGLLHTFNGGCANDDCLLQGDKICDTPPDNSTFDFCQIPTNSCVSDDDDLSTNNPYRPISIGGLGDQNDLNQNYMDYNIAECRESFTLGQAERMHFIVCNRYSELLSSKACLLPCTNEPIADFTFVSDTISLETVLTFTNTSTEATEYQWYINGIPTSTDTDLIYNANQTGTYIIALQASNDSDACDQSMSIQIIEVICPAESCIDYDYDDHILTYNSCSSVIADSVYWFIGNGGSSQLAVSSALQDSLYLNNTPYIEICLTSYLIGCSETSCISVTIIDDGSEICTNDIDDDGDGLVDLFDPDCPCNDLSYQAQCKPECEIIPDSFPDIQMKMKWQSDIISSGLFGQNLSIPNVYQNQDNDIVINIIGAKALTFAVSESSLFGLDPLTGVILKSENFHTGRSFSNTCMWKNNNEIKISAFKQDSIYFFDEEFNIIDKKPLERPTGNSINVTDFNRDGEPELYVNTSILNANTGNLLSEGEDRGCGVRPIDAFGNRPCFNSHTIAADLTQSPGIELAAGNILYEIEINNTTDSIGNEMHAIHAPAEVLDGFTSISDIDQDGELDIIVVRGQVVDGLTGTIIDEGGIWVWNPRDLSLIARASAGVEGGGVAFVGDVDGDCNPEIGMTFEGQLRLYQYNNTQELQLLWQIPTDDYSSGFTGVTMFDLNQDGKQELVYRDESTLKIINGENGNTLDSYPIINGTQSEYPVIADIDQDGQAEILIIGHESTFDSIRLYCFESATTPWAPARSVWNQYGYNPTFVNDDLTIPREPQHMATPLQGTENCEQETCNTPYNNFMVQATYRTQAGCLVWPSLESDLSITASATCVGDSVEICLYALASDTTIIGNGVTVTCWPEPPLSNDEPLDQITITEDTTCLMVYLPDGIESILVAINNDGSAFPPIFPNPGIDECDYSNNQYLLDVEGPDYVINEIFYDCTPDSLIYYLVIDNVGNNASDSCISVVCRLFPADDPEGIPLEVTSWYFDINEETGEYIYYDTVRIATPISLGDITMYWSINDIGEGPGINSLTECGTSNNEISIDINIFEGPILDIGPDIIKCQSEVVTLTASNAYYTYQWSDLSNDSIFSTSFEGIHSVTVTDRCGQSQVDSMRITIDRLDDVQLSDTIICEGDVLNITLNGDYDDINWIPSTAVSCDTCASTTLTDTISELIVIVKKLNCVSADTMQITYRESDTTFISRMICQGDSTLLDTDWFTMPGIYWDTLSNASGCDSLIQLDLNVVETLTSFENTTICAGDSTFWGVTWLDTEGTYIDTLQSLSGCDSIAQIDIMTIAPIVERDTFSLCEGDTLLLWDLEILSEGDYDTLLFSSIGCDSLLDFHVYEISSIMTYDTLQYCLGDTIELLEFILWDTEEITQTSLSSNGCDSTHAVYAIFHPTFSQYDTLNICNGDTLQIWNSEIYAPTDTSNLLTSIYGCDSTIYLNVIVDDIIDISIDKVICDGDSIMVYDQWYNEAITTEIFRSGAQSCDSIITLSVSLWESYALIDTTLLCQGDTVMIADTIITDETSFMRHYNSINGCDSTMQYQIIELRDTLVTKDYVLCPGDSIWVDGIYYFQDTIIEEFLIGQNSCDSIHLSIISSLNAIEPTMTILCEDRQVQMEINISENWNILWSNGEMESSTLYINAGEESIILSSIGCVQEYYFTIPELPNIEFIPDLIDTSVTQGSSLYIDLELDETIWSINWSPESILDCSTCSDVNISPTTTSEINLALTDSLGCMHELQFSISLKTDADIIVPNIFSPNQDGVNDTWSVFADEGITLIQCSIYDRWGTLISNISTLKDFSWDGSYRGQQAITGVYVYFLEYLDEQGNEQQMAGDLTLVR